MNNKKKILFVDHDPTITGSTVSMHYLIDGFCKKDFQIILITPKSIESLDYFNNYTLDIIHWRYKTNLALDFTNSESFFSVRGQKSLIRLLLNFVKGLFLSFYHIKKVSPDFIYINEYVFSQFSVSGKLLGIPVVTHIRSPFLKGNWGLRRYIFSNILKHFNDYIFAISEKEAQQVLENIQDTPPKVKIIREFLDQNDFFIQDNIQDLKASFSIPEGKIILLMAGGIESIKGSYELLIAFRKALVIHKDLFLVLVGSKSKDESYNQNCFNYIKENELSKSIMTINFVKDIHPLLSCCDILISSSTFSHFSRPAIEAWAQKKVVIASSTEHSRLLIEDKVDGLLYETGNPDSLAEKISLVLSNREILSSLGSAGYSKAKDLYSAEKNIDQILDYCLPLIYSEEKS